MVYLFIEGPDDEKFFSRVFGGFWGEIKYIQYSGWTNGKINNFIKSISCMPTSCYYFIGDADGKSIEQKANILAKKYKNLECARVFIVQYEIESWYYAGIGEALHQKLGMKRYIYCTDCLTKEDFNFKLSKKMDRKYAMSQILSFYDLQIALNRNNSLRIFNNGIKKEPA